ncbi:MAG: hypothetical protein methR_P3932 [Methyloprofundus sp.]|nr:MAG: hypothetical protein methR_P3932 [Methyloprofundus sp.]
MQILTTKNVAWVERSGKQPRREAHQARQYYLQAIKMPVQILAMLLLCTINNLVAAESLYLQAINNTVLTDEQLQKSTKKVEEHKPVALRGELEVPPFHKRSKVVDSLGNSFCTTCHQTPPHTKSVRSRTFMNMHTQYVACETCHFRPEGQQLSYQWQDTRDASVVRAQAKLFRQVKEEKPADTATSAGQIQTKNPFYKITPFYGQQAVALRRESTFAQETKKIWEQKGAVVAKATRRAMIHAPLSEKGPKCQACHSDEETLFDLAELGATSYQVEKIQNNIVTQFFNRYTDEEQRIQIMSLLR